MSDKLDDGYGGTLARKCEEGLRREGQAHSTAPAGSAATCRHIIAYADERDAHPCPVCEVQRLREAMRHAEFWRYPPTGVGWTTCRGCGCVYSPRAKAGEVQCIMPTDHKPDCPFRFWLDEDGRVVMPANEKGQR